MDTPPRQRRYSEEEQAEALAALAANNNNAALTAAQLGIPERTLRSWRSGEYSVPSAALAAAKRERLAKGIRKLTRRVLKKVLKVAADPDEKVSLRDGMVALGICVDKQLALAQANAGAVPTPETDDRLELFRKHFGQSQVIAQELHLHLHLSQAPAQDAPPATPLLNVTPPAFGQGEGPEIPENTGNPSAAESAEGR